MAITKLKLNEIVDSLSHTRGELLEAELSTLSAWKKDLQLHFLNKKRYEDIISSLGSDNTKLTAPQVIVREKAVKMLAEVESRITELECYTSVVEARLSVENETDLTSVRDKMLADAQVAK